MVAMLKLLTYSKSRVEDIPSDERCDLCLHLFLVVAVNPP